jgi:small subunit ribosomal protein S21
MRDSQDRKTKKPSKKTLKGGDSFKSDVAAIAPSEFAHIEPVQAKPLEVIVYNNNFDKALRAFRALVQKERILSTYKENQSYEKPSDWKRRKRNESKRKSLDFEDSGKKPTFIKRVKTLETE